MAVLETILSFFTPVPAVGPETVVVPAPPTTYSIRPLTADQLDEVLRLNFRCFRNGENYTRHTFSYLLSEPQTLSYRVVTAEGEMAAFVFVMINHEGAAHVTTIGVAPEHRRRGLATRMLEHVERALKKKGLSTVVLEVRVGNTAAQDLYKRSGYSVVQRIATYYHNGEDGFLMMKSLI
jgi:[ribosomal protein S18]-alanine N-acetyltransferase